MSSINKVVPYTPDVFEHSSAPMTSPMPSPIPSQTTESGPERNPATITVEKTKNENNCNCAII